MQFSFMTFSTPELALAEVLATAQRFGYDSVELRLDSGHTHGIEVTLSGDDRKRVREAVARSGKAISCLATSCVFADPAKREAMTADALLRITLAGDIGAPTMRVFGGVFPDTISREEAIAGVVSSLRRLADAAAKHNVIVCMETHDAWCDPAHVAEVLTRVDHPNIAANWDILHPIRMGLATIGSSFEALKPWIRHMHIHDWKNDALAPIGTGIVDHEKALALVRGIGYTGAASGEWINWEPYETHLPREIATLKTYR
ncbi:MAG: sugar phosphate isomerase/epimerase family protein [Spirochaetota bacterium]